MVPITRSASKPGLNAHVLLCPVPIMTRSVFTIVASTFMATTLIAAAFLMILAARGKLTGQDGAALVLALTGAAFATASVIAMYTIRTIVTDDESERTTTRAFVWSGVH